jgi:hypothetical protein
MLIIYHPSIDSYFYNPSTVLAVLEKGLGPITCIIYGKSTAAANPVDFFDLIVATSVSSLSISFIYYINQ